MQMAVVGRIVLPILACGRGVPMARLLRLSAFLSLLSLRLNFSLQSRGKMR